MSCLHKSLLEGEKEKPRGKEERDRIYERIQKTKKGAKMFKYNIDEEIIVKVKIVKRKDTGKENLYLVQEWVTEEDIVPIMELDEAIEEVQKDEIVDNLPKNGHGETDA